MGKSIRRYSQWSRYAFVIGIAGLSAHCGGRVEYDRGTDRGVGNAGGSSGVDAVAGIGAGAWANAGTGAWANAGTGAWANAGAGAWTSAGAGAWANAGTGAQANAGAPSSFGGGGAAGSDPLGGLAGEAGSAGEPGVRECAPGMTTCYGAAPCSVNLKAGKRANSTVNHCGACGLTCGLTNANSARCNDGICQPICSPGFANCGQYPSNGCETDLNTLSNCGACGRSCSPNGAAVFKCEQQACMPVCAPRYADCKRDKGKGVDDGCETYLDSLTQCGSSCANAVACSPTQVCNSGVCGTARGLAALSMPFSDVEQVQRYTENFSKLDLTNLKITARLYAPGASGGSVTLYAGGAVGSSQPTTVSLRALSKGWTDVEITVGERTTYFDTRAITYISLDVRSGTDKATVKPAVIYVDGFRSSNGLLNETFDRDVGSIVKSGLVTVSGASHAWADSVP